MDSTYQQAQPYPIYEIPQWSDEYKQTYAERENGPSCVDRLSASATPADFSAIPLSRRPSMLKIEDEQSAAEAMWHDSSHDAHYLHRHYSQPSISTHIHQNHQPYMRIDPNFAASYAHQPWPISHSGTSTPTPTYGSIDSYGHPVQYAAHSGFNFNQDPLSATSMSPQSSQGGWASATSSDGNEQRFSQQSPTYRPVSPQLVLRPDGIRKKNARFEIPKERNLHTIDALIMASTDDNEKKELKQQKRLLRNRQAALDSRQRKKSHTEKLELEKKMHEKRMTDLEDTTVDLERQLQIERDQWTQQRHHYEMRIQQIIQERDEAIRQKTIEAADCRRQMNAMREYIREHQLDRQSHRGGYAPASDMNNIASDFSEFNVIDDDWENEFSLIDNHDFGVDDIDSMQRQATPRPPVATTSEKKGDTEFGWSTFYMCLLFGAVVVSAGGQLSKLANGSADVSLPSVSAEYRADAENVLKAVMSSDPQSAQDMIPTRSTAAEVQRASAMECGLPQMSTVSRHQHSSLDKLSSTLSTPSRYQQLQQAFAMTPAQYNHIMNPLGDLEVDAEAASNQAPKQTRLEAAMAALYAKKSEVERAGPPSKTSARSALQVPESVMDELRDFYQSTKAAETAAAKQE